MSVKTHITCLKCSLLALFLLLLQPLFGQVGFEELTDAFMASQKSLGKDGVLMLWKKNDTLVYKKEMGEFNSKTQAPLGDASKWLTAALVMQFVDEGKLSLDDKITRWLPEYEKYGKNYITIGICLGHMTGIKEPNRRKGSTLEEVVNDYASKEIRSNPGTDFWYGMIGYDILGRVMEVISKKNFDVLIKQKLFTPMEMRRTTFTNPENGATNPSEGAQATADDFIKFLSMLLNGGKYKGKQVLSAESVEKLLQIQVGTDMVKSTPKLMQNAPYTYGAWVQQEKNGKATVVVCPGLPGTWAMLDLCRGYAYLYLPKKPLHDEKPEAHAALKKLADEKFSGDCGD